MCPKCGAFHYKHIDGWPCCVICGNLTIGHTPHEDQTLSLKNEKYDPSTKTLSWDLVHRHQVYIATARAAGQEWDQIARHLRVSLKLARVCFQTIKKYAGKAGID